MAYPGSGRFPIEHASKIGHVKLIQEPHIQRWLNAFEQVDSEQDDQVGELSGHLPLSDAGNLENIVAIDGSHVAVPNAVYHYKRLAFVTAAAVIIRRSEVSIMKAYPISDPREMAKRLQNNAHNILGVIPLAGISLPGEKVVESIRKTVEEILLATGLYDTLQFLISREWLSDYVMEAHMNCVFCGEEFLLKRSTRRFRCPNPTCQRYNTLADYVGILHNPPEDWVKEEAVINLRNILETLLLMSLLRSYMHSPVVLSRTLFVKDGPLLLRAQLSRLIEPIRAFLAYLKEKGRNVYLIGIEKTGELVDHLPQIKPVLKEPGDYFLPTVQYLHEHIQGVPFNEQTYRNRVQYGSKVIIRLGTDHVIVCNVPTGTFLLSPHVTDLYGFHHAITLLAEMTSYSYENALIPLVLANSAASISMRPSSDILEAFAKRLLQE